MAKSDWFSNRVPWLGAGAGILLWGGLWVAAELSTPGIRIGRFPELPEPVSRDLQERGCRIVESSVKGHMNVIRGDFAQGSGVDWAVLCLQGKQESLLVYRDGGGAKPDVLTTIPAGQESDPEFSHSIRPVRTDYIQRHQLPGSPAREMSFEHAGIEHATGMGSLIFYHSEGGWRQLPGAD